MILTHSLHVYTVRDDNVKANVSGCCIPSEGQFDVFLLWFVPNYIQVFKFYLNDLIFLKSKRYVQVRLSFLLITFYRVLCTDNCDPKYESDLCSILIFVMVKSVV